MNTTLGAMEISSDNGGVTTGENQTATLGLTIPDQNPAQPGRPNKSFFEITRVETTGHGENTGELDNENEGDSEMDDTLDHDLSNTVNDENSIKHNDTNTPITSSDDTN